jgi:hypothetical protein
MMWQRCGERRSKAGRGQLGLRHPVCAFLSSAGLDIPKQLLVTRDHPRVDRSDGIAAGLRLSLWGLTILRRCA